MKAQSTRKSRIIIPELIKKIKRSEADKQNICTNGPLTDKLPEPSRQVKMKISQYLNQSNDSHKNQALNKNQQSVQKTHQSTHRTLQISQENCMQSMIIDQPKNKSNQLAKFELLLKSDRMFINPDKWSQFMNRAMEDQNFHKSLNIFLYSYFIQHYN